MPLIKQSSLSMRQEFWAPVVGFEKYQVSDMGNVRSSVNTRGRPSPWHLMSPYIDKQTGYRFINFRRDGRHHKRWVHRLVATAFIPKPQSDKPLQVRHVYTNARHVAVAWNLAWGTQAENEADKIRHGTSRVRRLTC